MTGERIRINEVVETDPKGVGSRMRRRRRQRRHAREAG